MSAPPAAVIEWARRINEDFVEYSRVLTIVDKGGEKRPLVLNRAQLELHRRIEEQLAQTGKVRVLVLKGRQQGISTYLQARLRWLLKKRGGRKAYTMAHEIKATNNLFKMAKRYHDHEPEAIRPITGASNANELLFSGMDCRMEVATAGTKDTGRSSTVQLLHGSEYAFWENAESHWAGIGQTVPDLPGTEVWIESTANGVKNDFYARWKQAINGVGDFIPIFLPWFWQPEYRRALPPDWKRDDDENELAQLYGLDDEQLAWRRNKIESDFNGDASRFQQEYPCNWQEAFVAEQRDTFIPAKLVIRAQSTQTEAYGPMVVGVDPARFGDDATAIVVRQGRRVRAVRRYEKKSTMEVAGICARFIEATPQMDMMFIDVIGIGAGVYDRLVELGYGDKVRPVNSSESAAEDEKYANKRAECWGGAKRWLEEGPVQLPPDDDEKKVSWLGDLTAPGYTYTSNGALRLEKKEDIKKREGRSPDVGDALALTFAEPVRKRPQTAPLIEHEGVRDDVVGV